MTLREFVEEMAQALADFEKHMVETYPDLDSCGPGEWDEQFMWFLEDSGKRGLE